MPSEPKIEIQISDELAAYARLYGELVFCVPHYQQSRHFEILCQNKEAVRRFQKEGL